MESPGEVCSPGACACRAPLGLLASLPEHVRGASSLDTVGSREAQEDDEGEDRRQEEGALVHTVPSPRSTLRKSAKVSTTVVQRTLMTQK